MNYMPVLSQALYICSCVCVRVHLCVDIRDGRFTLPYNRDIFFNNNNLYRTIVTANNNDKEQ